MEQTVKYIDIGVNLFDKQFRGKEEEIAANAKKNGVGMVITGSSLGSSKMAAEYVGRHPGVYATAGVHPHSAKSCDEHTIATLRKLIQGTPGIVAVGECGLDYDRMFSPMEVQKEWFEKQILLAEEMQLPLFLHERKAEDDFMKIMKGHRAICKRSVVHCFTGSKETVLRYMNLGCMIGITGWLCDERRNQELLEAVARIPLQRLMVETDAPYLTPRIPGLSRNNVPENIVYVVKKLAEIKQVDEAELQQQLLENSKKFFCIS